MTPSVKVEGPWGPTLEAKAVSTNTAVTTKGIKDGLFWANKKWPWPGNKILEFP